jgi:hypothetical protein
MSSLERELESYYSRRVEPEEAALSTALSKAARAVASEDQPPRRWRRSSR